MTDKVFKIGSSMEAVPSSSLDRTIKMWQDRVNKSTNIDDITKKMNKLGALEKGYSKILKENGNKVLKEREQLWGSIVKTQERAIKLGVQAEKRSTTLTNIRARGLEQEMGVERGFIGPGSAQWNAMKARAMNDVQNRSLGNVMSTQGVLDQESMAGGGSSKFQNRMMGLSYGLGAAGTVASIVGDLYGQKAKELSYGARSASFAGQLYQEINNRDYSSLRGIGIADKMGSSEFQTLIENAKSSALWHRGGQALISAGGVAGGGALMVGSAAGAVGSGGAAAPLSLAAGAAGLGVALGGFKGIANAWMDVAAGEGSSRMAEMASAGVGYYNQLNPIAKAQFDKVSRSASNLQALGAMSGGTGTSAYLSLASSTHAGGLTGEEAMPYFQALRSGIGHNAAQALTGVAASSLNRYGMDRSTAVSALTAASGLQGGAGQAEARLEQILARAFRAGLKDTAVQGALATSLPGMLSGIAGRGSGVGSAADTMSSEIVRLGGGMPAFNIAAQAYQGTSAVMGNHGPIGALNTAQSGTIFAIAAKHGLDAAATRGLNAVGSINEFKTATKGGKIWNMLNAAGKGDQEIPTILAELAGGMVATGNAFFNDAFGGNSDARDLVLARAGIGGGNGEVVESIFRGSSLGRGAPVAGGFRIGNNASQSALNAYQANGASNADSALIAGLSDPKMIDGLKNLSSAANILTTSLNAMSTMSPEKLASLPAVLNEIAAALYNVQLGAGGKAPATPPTPSVTSGTVSPWATGTPMMASGRNPRTN